jgi:hypothetical protein
MKPPVRIHRTRNETLAGRNPRDICTLARPRVFLSIACLATAAALLATLPCRASDEVEAIASKVSKDYVRRKLPDGTFRPESYVFGKGDNLGGARVDPTIDKMEFMDVARVIAVPLAEKRYLPTSDPKTTNLLIMVYWGTTRAPEYANESNSLDLMQKANVQMEVAKKMMAQAAAGTSRNAKMIAAAEAAAVDDALLAATIGVQAENQRREDVDMKNATLLGYDSWWIATNSAMDGSPLGRRKADMNAELEEDRYFVVLSAFDYQALVKTRKMKFQWEVRFSIREHGTAFDTSIARMVAKASEYFGRDSGGLQHVDLPIGKVEIGPVESLGTVDGK